MRRTAFVLMAMAVCVMMVAPMGMAAPQKGKAAKYSGLEQDFQAGPSVGDWGTIYVWQVSALPHNGNAIQGGTVRILNPPSGVYGIVNNAITFNTHGEAIGMKDSNGNRVNPSKLAVGPYTCPGNKINELWISIDLYDYPWFNNQKIWMTIHTKMSFIQGSTVNVQVTSDGHLIITGSNLEFHYDDMHQSIEWNTPRFGKSFHSFTITIDI